MLNVNNLNYLKLYLTTRQIEVLELIDMGYDRKEIGRSLMPPVCVQAVHQIILRIRKRLKSQAGLKHIEIEKVGLYGSHK